MTTIIKTSESLNLSKSFANLQTPLMIWLLQSPLHGIVSSSYLLIEVCERKTGLVYTIPARYKKQGNTVTIISNKNYSWWRNLEDGASFQVTLRGKERQAWGFASEQRIDVKAAYLSLYPQMSKAFRDKLVPKSVVIHMELR